MSTQLQLQLWVFGYWSPALNLMKTTILNEVYNVSNLRFSSSAFPLLSFIRSIISITSFLIARGPSFFPYPVWHDRAFCLSLTRTQTVLFSSILINYIFFSLFLFRLLAIKFESVFISGEMDIWGACCAGVWWICGAVCDLWRALQAELTRGGIICGTERESDWWISGCN